MSLVFGILLVTTASGVALFVNDHFDLGGYIDDEQLSAPAEQQAVEQRELVTAGR